MGRSPGSNKGVDEIWGVSGLEGLKRVRESRVGESRRVREPTNSGGTGRPEGVRVRLEVWVSGAKGVSKESRGSGESSASRSTTSTTTKSYIDTPLAYPQCPESGCELKGTGG